MKHDLWVGFCCSFVAKHTGHGRSAEVKSYPVATAARHNATQVGGFGQAGSCSLRWW